MNAVHSEDIDVLIKVFPAAKDGKRVVTLVLTDQGKAKLFTGTHRMELKTEEFQRCMDRLSKVTDVELDVLNGSGGTFAACESSKELLAQELLVELLRTLSLRACLEFPSCPARLSPV